MKYLILGAGPAGLTFANKLKQYGIDDFIILEKESEAGGLCRSINVDGAPFDIGGGHFLDVRRPKVNEFLFQFMPENEWNKFNRDSRIIIGGLQINHPIEANIWQMKVEDQVDYLKSIANAGCNTGDSIPKDFISWIYWKLGSKIAENYMIPYNQKMFGNNLNGLGTYWLDKLPNVSFEETLLSCLTQKSLGQQPGHAQFYYPKKYGYGELWKRMADSIKKNIEYGKVVSGIDFDNNTISTTDGLKYQADIIVTSIPWMEFGNIKGMPINLKDSINKLKFSSIQTEYVPEKIKSEAHWIYYPDLNLPYHRSLIRHNFCPNSKGYWTETNSERISSSNFNSNFKHFNKYAYPLNTLQKPEIMKSILEWSESRNVYGLGRWGEHQHYNSDVTVELSMKLADRLEGNKKW
jgi:protoporphyrinogen oxidase